MLVMVMSEVKGFMSFLSSDDASGHVKLINSRSVLFLSVFYVMCSMSCDNIVYMLQ